jgi:hypothetical protein
VVVVARLTTTEPRWREVLTLVAPARVDGAVPEQRTTTPDDHAWRESAACLGKPLVWFTVDTEAPTEDNEHGLALCADCPVKDACLLDAVVHRDRGVIRGGVRLRRHILACRRCHLLLPRSARKRAHLCQSCVDQIRRETIA